MLQKRNRKFPLQSPTHPGLVPGRSLLTAIARGATEAGGDWPARGGALTKKELPISQARRSEHTPSSTPRLATCRFAEAPTTFFQRLVEHSVPQ